MKQLRAEPETAGVTSFSGCNLDGQSLFKVNPEVPVSDALEHASCLITIQREFATVVGSGMFAMKKAQRNALTATGLGEWVTYWLVDFEAAYANDLANWAAYVETDLQAERQTAEASYAAVQDLRPRTGQSIEWPWNEQDLQVGTPTDDLPKQILENVEARRSFLQDEYARQYAEERRIAAWLRGEAGDPPLLTLMQGAA